MEKYPEKIRGLIHVCNDKTKKIFLWVGIGFGALSFANGLHLYTLLPQEFSLQQILLTSLCVGIYFAGIPYLINLSVEFIKPVYINFDKLCTKHHINYEIITGYRSVSIKFAKGTPLKDRFRLGFLYHLITFLEAFTLIVAFFVALGLMVLITNIV